MIVFVVIVTVLLLVIYKFVHRNFDYWKKKKVVYKEPVAVFGNYSSIFLQTENIGQAAQKLYNQHPNEKVVGVFLGNEPTLLIRDPDLIKLVVAKDYYYFNSRGFDFNWKVEPLEANVFSISGDYWRVLRHNLTPLFSSAKMKNMFPLVVQSGEEFEKLLTTRLEQTDVMEFRDLLSRFSMDVIGSCAFGLRMNSISQEQTVFRKMGAEIFEGNFFKNVKAIMRVTMPSVYYFLKLRVLRRELELFFINLVQSVIQSRQGQPVERHDFIDLLKELKDRGHIKGDSIESMKGGGERKTIELAVDDKLLAAQSFIFFAAGYETSATTMSYALYELAMNKSIHSRLQTEIDILLEKHEYKITYDLLQEANYLDMVVSETLRKYPVLGVLDRQCTSKYTFPDIDLTIEPGVRIQLPVYAIHHDPQFYPQPDLFDPERFAPDVKNDRNQYTYMPFGEGHRICIGLRFGKMQVMVGLISLLRGHSVEPCAKTEAKIEFQPKAVITMAKNGIWLKLTVRKKNK